MRRLAVLLITGIFLTSSIGLSLAATAPQPTIDTTTITFASPTLQEQNGTMSILLPEATSYTTTPSEPQLPTITKVFTLPFRTSLDSVAVTFTNDTSISISVPIQTPAPISPDDSSLSTYQPFATIPDCQYQSQFTAGRSTQGIVDYLSVQLHPVRYDPHSMVLHAYHQATITLTYHPGQPLPQPQTSYKLVIITADEFASALQPLVNHKNTHGVATKLVTWHDITNGTYFPPQGRDDAETMKYFIKNAVDTWFTTYVLLVGGRRGGLTEEHWLLPVRYSHLDDGGEGSFLTDLYFEDLYNADGNFSTWDSNGNGNFAEWTHTAKDIIDMYPDVYVGRLPCSHISEVKTMVKKIITYETKTAGKDWFKRFIGVAGDTYPDDNDSVFEGEAATKKSFTFLEPLGFTATFLWTSLGTFQDKQDVIDNISEGAGFVHFSGHGNPGVWSTHQPYNNSFIDGLGTFDMRKLHNGDKLPVVIVGGCHNAQYNTSLWNIPAGVLKYGLKGYFSSHRPYGRFYWEEWVPRCWGWNMLAMPHGGCIGLVANTGLGYGQPGWDTLNESGRCLEWKFFESYANGNTALGATHGQSLISYMNLHPPMENQMDCKIIQEWALLGDPSLQIGGYS